MIQLREHIEEKKTRSILEKEKEIEAERKLYPVFNPQNLLNSNTNSRSSRSSFTSTQIEDNIAATATATAAATISTDQTQLRPESNAVIPEVLIASNVTTLKLTKKHRHRPNFIEPTSVDETKPKNTTNTT